MEPPNLCDLQNAIDLLIAMGAMDGEEVLTPLGKTLNYVNNFFLNDLAS